MAPLHMAAERGRFYLVKNFVGEGADIDIKDNTGVNYSLLTKLLIWVLVMVTSLQKIKKCMLLFFSKEMLSAFKVLWYHKHGKDQILGSLNSIVAGSNKDEYHFKPTTRKISEIWILIPRAAAEGGKRASDSQLDCWFQFLLSCSLSYSVYCYYCFKMCSSLSANSTAHCS